MSAFALGPYVVQERPWCDCRYFIYLGELLIGKCYSKPVLSDCEFLHRKANSRAVNAGTTAQPSNMWAEKQATRRSNGRRERGPRD